MRCLLLTEAGAAVGFGHATRCHALSYALNSFGYEADVWVRHVGSNPYPSMDLNFKDWWNIAETEKAALRSCDLIVVDTFLAEQGVLDELFSLNSRIAFIDDYIHRDYPAGLVIDWTMAAEFHAYPVKCEGVRYLLGSRYCVLRPSFWQTEDIPVSRSLTSLMVTFGGCDIRSLTEMVVQHLHRAFPTVDIHAVLGPGFYHGYNGNPCQDEKIHFHSSLDANAMKKLMYSCDLAICGGGQTLYELASCGLPPLVVELIDNQNDDIQGFVGIGFAEFVGSWEEKKLMDNIVMAIRKLEDPCLRSDRARIGRQAIDGRGAMRVAQELDIFRKISP